MIVEQTGIPLHKACNNPSGKIYENRIKYFIELQSLVWLIFIELLLYIISSTQQSNGLAITNYFHYKDQENRLERLSNIIRFTPMSCL